MGKRSETASAPAPENLDAPFPISEPLEPVVVEDNLQMVRSTDVDTFAEDSGDNNFAKQDLAIPFIRALQTLSPQVNERDPAYIPGAKEGMLYNTVTNELWKGDPGIVVIPVAYTPSFTEWKPKRGGFVKDYGSDDSVMGKTVVNDKKESVLSNGNNIVRAGLYFLFVYDEVAGAVSQAAFSLSSSGLKVSRKWNTNIQGVMLRDKSGRPFNPAMFYLSYRLSTTYQSNDQGNWWGYEIKPYKPTVELGVLGAEIYMACRGFKKLVTEGAVQVKHEVDQETKDDVPF